MTISWIQAILLGIFASLSSMPGMGGSSIGNYTLGRPLIGGLISGLILGDVTTGIMVGVALQVVYIALVTPGGTVSADVRAISYIGVPLAILFVHANNITDEAGIAAAAAPIGAAVGTIGTVLFYGTATMNLVWQHIGWKAVEEGRIGLHSILLFFFCVIHFFYDWKHRSQVPEGLHMFLRETSQMTIIPMMECFC